jgi:hypothetical protein
MGKKPALAVQSPAGRRLDRKAMRDLVEPEAEDGGPTDTQGVSAVACELADRTYHKTWTPVLNSILAPQRTAGTVTR